MDGRPIFLLFGIENGYYHSGAWLEKEEEEILLFGSIIINDRLSLTHSQNIIATFPVLLDRRQERERESLADNDIPRTGHFVMWGGIFIFYDVHFFFFFCFPLFSSIPVSLSLEPRWWLVETTTTLFEIIHTALIPFCLIVRLRFPWPAWVEIGPQSDKRILMMEECFNIFQRYFLHFHNSSERTSGRLCGNWQEEWKITFFTDLQARWMDRRKVYRVWCVDIFRSTGSIFVRRHLFSHLYISATWKFSSTFTFRDNHVLLAASPAAAAGSVCHRISSASPPLGGGESAQLEMLHGPRTGCEGSACGVRRGVRFAKCATLGETGEMRRGRDEERVLWVGLRGRAWEIWEALTRVFVLKCNRHDATADEDNLVYLQRPIWANVVCEPDVAD